MPQRLMMEAALLVPYFLFNSSITNIYLVLMSEEKVKETGVKPLARIVSYADSEVDPIDFCIAPAKSSQLALDRVGMKMS